MTEICVVKIFMYVNLLSCVLQCSCICGCWTDNVIKTYEMLHVLYFILITEVQ